MMNNAKFWRRRKLTRNLSEKFLNLDTLRSLHIYVSLRQTIVDPYNNIENQVIP